MSKHFGFDAPKNRPLEESIRWAAENGFYYIDFQADQLPNHLASFTPERTGRIQELCQAHGHLVPGEGTIDFPALFSQLQT